MTSESLSFGGVADRYDRARPDYPDDAVAWLVGDRQARVLELGAGTGKMTGSLVALDHLVLATDPDERMLHLLGHRVPDACAAAATAERIPAADRSVDVVVVAQAFHWFDHAQALPEIARVLRPGGILALVWNQRDEGSPWVKKLGRMIGGQDQHEDLTAPLAASDLFGEIEHQGFRHWQLLKRAEMLDLAASRSNVATLPEEDRDAVLEAVGGLYDEYGRGPEGMQLPYRTQCYRAVVRRAPEVVRPATTARRTPPADGEPTQPMNRADLPGGPTGPPTPPEKPDDGTLLIDFR